MKNRAMLPLVSFLALLAGDATAQWANPQPEEANIHYPRGEAPFYVGVQSYARHLNRLFERGMQPALQNELDALGVDAAELGAIYTVISSYRAREDEARIEGWRQECIPLLRGDAITDEVARQAFVRRDGTAWREVVAEAVLHEIESAQGAAIAEKVRQRIAAQGEAIRFTKSDFVKVIELGRGGLFLSHMMIECGTHPDYPKR